MALAAAPIRAQICSTRAAAPEAPNFDGSAKFFVHRSGTFGQDLRFRDAEFMWDSLYATGLSADVRTTLRNFGHFLAESVGTAPLAGDARNTEAVFNYLNRENRTWLPEPGDLSAGLRVGNATYLPQDLSHVDAYITHWSHDQGGQQPSNWYVLDEDLSSGHAYGDIAHDNSIHMGGPNPTTPLDVNGAGWTLPRSPQFGRFNHEMSHALMGNDLEGAYAELWAAAAEVVSGVSETDVTSEVPYTWSLLAWLPPAVGPPIAPGQPGFHNRFSLSNYQARTAFMAYLGYNFLNADTTRTLTGMRDDVMYKWNRDTYSWRLPQLGYYLSDAQCATCAGRQYFHPGGQASTAKERVAMLHHNWRVANFVNNPNLAEGQFGYPSWSGFSPSVHLKAWQSRDGVPETDIVALPAIATIDSSAFMRETVLQGMRSFRGAAHPMTLAPYSANYWVLRPSQQLTNSGQDLVIRVSPRAFFRSDHNDFDFGGPRDVRLMVSAVAYNQPDIGGDESALWQMPAAAVYSTNVSAVDCDSVAGDLTLTIPGFGTTHKAAVLVVSLADGPSQGWGYDSMQAYYETLPYRLSMSLRPAAVSSYSQDPVAISVIATTPDDWTTWAPDNNAVAWSAYDASVSQYAQIYRRQLTGGPVKRVFAQAFNQFSPSWSPKGDRVAFVTYLPPSAGQYDIYVADTASQGGMAWKVSSLPGWSTLPSFQPNGAGLAYIYQSSGGGQLQLRWVGADGSGDRLIASIPWIRMVPPRWTRDGRYVVLCHESNNQLVRYRVTTGATSVDPAGSHNLRDFDLHPGTGRLAVVSADSLRNFATSTTALAGWPSQPAIGAARVALLDSTAAGRDTAYRFVSRGYNAANVRWSPDGTKIAYTRVAGQNGNRDVYYARVSWNRAPIWSDLADQQVPACVPFTIQLSASDPDGDSLRYEAAYLPPGAIMLTATTFRWQFPQTGEYDVVFRALDNRDGVNARVVHISVFDSEYCYDGLVEGGGAGEGAATQRGASMLAAGATSAPTSQENSLLDGTAPEAWAEQFARVTNPQFGENGSVSLSLRMGTGPGSDVDRVQFVTADHPAGTTAFATSQGIIAGMPVDPAALSGPEGAVVLAAATCVEPYFAPGGSALSVSSDSSGISAVVVRCRRASTRTTDPSAGVAVQVEQNGVWITVDRLQPRRVFDALAAQVPHTGVVRLLFGADVLVETVKVLGSLVEPSLVPAGPAEGTASAALGAVGAADGEAWHLEPGESVQLAFAVSTGAPLAERSYFLQIRGRYLAARRTESMRSQHADTEFKLAFDAPRPNPFSRRTTLSYSLPKREEVRIEVMDMQGRRIRTLMNQTMAPGQYSIEWDGRDAAGRLAAPGVYLARMVVGADKFQRRLVLIP